MASPKKARTEYDELVSGYVHCVSPIKVSEKNYKFFNAIIQTDRDQFHRAVIFSPEKHTPFLQASKNVSPVKVSGVKKVLSYSGGDTYDVQVSRWSSLQVTEVPFLPKQPIEGKKLSVAEVLGLALRQHVGEVHGKVIAMKASSEVFNVRGVETEVRQCSIADGSGRVQLQLWESQVLEVEVGSSYKFSHVSTRQHGGVIYLTCSKETSISKISTVEVSEALLTEETEPEEVITVVSMVHAVQLLDKRQCMQCKRRQTDFKRKADFHRCEGCGMKQHGAAYLSIISGTIVVSGARGRVSLIMSMSAIKAYVQSHNLPHLLGDVEDLEEHFLEGEFEVSHSCESMLTRIQKHKATVGDNVELRDTELLQVFGDMEYDSVVGEAPDLRQGQAQSQVVGVVGGEGSQMEGKGKGKADRQAGKVEK